MKGRVKLLISVAPAGMLLAVTGTAWAQEAVRLEEGEAAYHVLVGEVYQDLDRLPEARAGCQLGVQLAPEAAP